MQDSPDRQNSVSRRGFIQAGTVAATTAAVATTLPAVARADTAAAGAPTALTVDYLTDPLGIDSRQPLLGWWLADRGHDVHQRAYQIRAAGTRGGLERAELWDTGRVVSPESANVPWRGRALTSRSRVYWQVRVWDTDGAVSPWSAPAVFEMGLLETGDWRAHWIGDPRWESAMRLHPVTIPIPRQHARCLGLTITKIAGGWVQLAEIGVVDSSDPSTDLAFGATVTASEAVSGAAGMWEPAFLTDGLLSSEGVPRGYSSASHNSDDLSDDPIHLVLDLGKARTFDRVLIYPRTDYLSDGKTTRYPVDFTIETGDAADGPFTVAKAVTGMAAPPPMAVPGIALPLLARQFTVRKRVARARLYATGLGVYRATVNGRPVDDSVLEPPNSLYSKHVVYATYDVTELLSGGPNTIGMALGNGAYNTLVTPDRHNVHFGFGAPKLIAQLEITYTDGSRDTIVSDRDWRTTLGPTTVSSWWGGEDYDARREPRGWDRPGADLGSWEKAALSTPPGSGTVLSARSTPPIEQVDTVHPIAVTEPKPGVYVVDFGLNFAGWARLRVHGPAGTTITMRPSELLRDDGTISQTEHQTGVPIWDSYTLSGHGEETWHPSFEYHGLRYLQLEGMPYRPDTGVLTGLVLRTANASAGSFHTSDQTLGSVHRIIDRAVQNNMYSVMTDCPDREKRGWLEEDELLFGMLARNYDIAAYFRRIIRAIADSQSPTGQVMSTAPGNVASKDVNWCDAVMLTPWQMYTTYGDAQTLRTYYPNMRRYLAVVRDGANDNLLSGSGGYGDWGDIDGTTPVGLVATWGYHRMVSAMAAIAGVLGEHADAVRYRRLAGDIATAFNTAYFHADTHSYGSGSQASDALALDLGVVPRGHRAAVLDHLIGTIHRDGNRYTVGEIALPSLFLEISDNGHDELAYDIAVQAASPGYVFALVKGATALPSYPDSRRIFTNSQAHWMFGALDEWFTRGLGGIRAADGSVGYRELVIRPAVVSRISDVATAYRTPYGTVRSAWQRSGRTFELDVTVPPNSTASVHVPLFGGTPEPAPRGARLAQVTGDRAVYRVGSGRWSFRSRTRHAARHYTGRLALAGVDRPLPVVPQLSGEVTLTVYNFGDDDVTVRPSTSTTSGFSARSVDGQVVVPGGGSARLRFAVDSTADAGTAGALTVSVEDRDAYVPLVATDDLARAATMSASSTYGNFSAADTNNGDISAQTDYHVWTTGHGWNDDTHKKFPDTLTATWPKPVSLEKVVVRTLDADSHPARVFGLRDYDVQARVAGGWQTVATVRASTAGTETRTFDAVTADALRLSITDTNDHEYSRVVELEAY